jgi:hypothetical protein
MTFFLAGCGGDGRLPITGTVSYKGEPIDHGSIEFIPTAGGKTASGAIITGGRFTIPADKGLLPGKYTVKISSVEVPAGGGAFGAPSKEAKEKIPEKYNKKSTLSKDVKDGETTFEFKLE